MFKIVTRTEIYKEFKTKMDLIKYLYIEKKETEYFIYHYRYEYRYRDTNKILIDCCHNWNDFYFIVEDKIKYFKYMIFDNYCRIMDIDLLAKQVFNFKPKPRKKRIYNYFYTLSEYWKKVEKRNKNVNFRFGKFSVQNERKISCDPMHKPYIRSRRRANRLNPGNFNDCKYDISWKNLKIEKQWMEKQKITRMIEDESDI